MTDRQYNCDNFGNPIPDTACDLCDFIEPCREEYRRKFGLSEKEMKK